jgi:hypothetical protein
MRAYMWALGREWLGRGAIDKDPKLEAALCGPGYSSDRHDKLVLESKESMKKRGLRSPDDADALFLTFAQQVMPKPPKLVRSLAGAAALPGRRAGLDGAVVG